ncbi:hypothetical protein, partial [Pseudomonas brassicacearum]|uniref:hypothetical protein n=1 Tax=Pseudomonas brassicacearum TaxID=930166 RepID=UPI001C831AF4
VIVKIKFRNPYLRMQVGVLFCPQESGFQSKHKFAQLFSIHDTRIGPTFSEPEPLCQIRLTPLGCQNYRWTTW